MDAIIEVNIPTCQELYDSLPDDVKDKRTKLYSDSDESVSIFEAVRFYYNRIVAGMVTDCKTLIKPAVYMRLFEKSDNQVISTWVVSDNNKPVENSYNFHGQNTSRWCSAGCLLYDIRDNTFSIHT